MVKDAEANAEADKQARTLIETRNTAENQAHQVRRDLDEMRDQLNEDEISEIETAVAAVEEAAKGDDVEAINEALQKVYPAMSSLLAKKQEQEQANAQAEAAEPANTEDDVVDAEFTEKKD